MVVSIGMTVALSQGRERSAWDRGEHLTVTNRVRCGSLDRHERYEQTRIGTASHPAPVPCHPGSRHGAGFHRRLLGLEGRGNLPVSYTHLRAHETDSYLVCR